MKTSLEITKVIAGTIENSTLTRLIELSKAYSLTALQDLKAEHLADEILQRDLAHKPEYNGLDEKTLSACAAINQIKGFAAFPLVEIQEQKNSFTGEHECFSFGSFDIIVYSSEADSVARLTPESCKKDKWGLSLTYHEHRQNSLLLNSNSRTQLYSIAEPNNIGAFTASKLANWFNYVKLYRETGEQEKRLTAEKIASVRSEYERIKIAKDWLEIRESNDNKLMYLKSTYFDIKVEIQDNGEYLYTKVSTHATLKTILNNPLI